MRIPSSERPVWATIWVSPAAAEGSVPATMSGRPALSSRMIASSVSASTGPERAAASMSRRKRSVRRTDASTPPGLFS